MREREIERRNNTRPEEDPRPPRIITEDGARKVGRTALQGGSQRGRNENTARKIGRTALGGK